MAGLAVSEAADGTSRRGRGGGSVPGRLARSRPAALGGALIALIVVVAAAGPALAPYNPITMNLSIRLAPPSQSHVFGTDALGRDILTRVLYGARLALLVGALSIALAGAAGIALGLAAGFYGGVLDSVLMSSVDVLLAFPYLLLALIVVTALGPGLVNAMIAVSIVYMPQYARLVRATVLAIRGREYAEAARAMGASNLRIMSRHILLNASAPIIVQSTVTFGSAIVSAATLGFLGLGAQPPAPEWGLMLSEGRNSMQVAPWVATFPGLAILAVAIGSNLLGDGLRDALDPRLTVR